MLLRTTSVSQRTEAYAKLAGLAGPVPCCGWQWSLSRRTEDGIARRSATLQHVVLPAALADAAGHAEVCALCGTMLSCVALSRLHMRSCKSPCAAVLKLTVCGCVEADRRRIERSAAPSLRTSGELRAEPHKHPHCCDDQCSRQTAPD
jgi:hypothetical protein